MPLILTKVSWRGGIFGRCAPCPSRQKLNLGSRANHTSRFPFLGHDWLLTLLFAQLRSPQSCWPPCLPHCLSVNWMTSLSSRHPPVAPPPPDGRLGCPAEGSLGPFSVVLALLIISFPLNSSQYHKKDSFYLSMRVCMLAGLRICECRYPQNLGEGTGFPGAGVTCSCEPSDVGDER